MEIKAGYKLTEVGIIPEDWAIKKLIEFLDYEQPIKYLVRDTDYNDNNLIPVLTAGKTFILGYTNEEHGIFKKLPVIIFDDFTTSIKYVDFPFKAKSSAMKMLIPKNDKVNLRFIYETMLQIKYQVADHKRHWIGEYSKLKIIVPVTIKEQNAIATALSDADALIDSLENLITKKRNIKQGAMQKLLQPKDDWEVKKLQEMFIKLPVKSYQINSSEYEKFGKFPVIDQGKKPIAGYSDNENKVFSCLEDGVMVFGDHTRIFKYVNYDFIIGADGTQLFSFKKGYNTLFLYYLLLMKEIPNTGYNRHFKFLLDMIICYPKSTEEQTRIATILSDMDAEITALETKLEKYKKIKLGMMQNLLTGKIRLI